jgi:hypothetical protein
VGTDSELDVEGRGVSQPSRLANNSKLGIVISFSRGESFIFDSL